jgi:H+/gluconate symporter-like permease
MRDMASGLRLPVLLLGSLAAAAIMMKAPISVGLPTLSLGVAAPAAALVGFATLLWRGVSVFTVAPAFSLALALSVEPGAPLTAFARLFAGNAGDFVGRFFLVFLLGAIFGRILVDSGCASGLARLAFRSGRPARAPLAVAGLCAMMTMGGVGVFVIAFAVFPIAREIYARAGLPLRLVPAAIALGAFTATMTAIPGAPSLTNIVAGTVLGTDAFAAPLPGLLAGLVMVGFGGWWLCRMAAQAPRVAPHRADESPAEAQPAMLAMLPLLVTVVANATLSAKLAALEESMPLGAWGHGYWAVVAALGLGIATTVMLGRPRVLLQSIDAGAASAIGPLLATAAGVGLGAMLAATPATEAVLAVLRASLQDGSVSFAAATTALYAAVVGSSSGGLLLALDLHATEFLAPGVTAPATVHRFASLGAGVFDTLPHSGAVLALLSICRATHAGSYRDIFVVTVMGPALALGAALTAFGSGG